MHQGGSPPRAASHPATLLPRPPFTLAPTTAHHHPQEGGGTHFKLRVVSASFDGLAAVRRHQLVYGLLDAQFRDGLHALNIVARTPAEAAAAAAAGKPI